MALARRASSVASTSLHIRIQPRPSNLSESRQILRVLQRFGELSTYKYLRYEYHSPAPNAALAIYRDPNSAQQALNASPIRFSLEKIEDDDTLVDEKESAASDDPPVKPAVPAKSGVEEMTRPSHLIGRTSSESHTSLVHTANTSTEKNASTSRQLPYQGPRLSKERKAKLFQLTIDRSGVIHQDFVERQPLWKQFSPMKSMAQEDLAKTVPHIGLSDVSKRPPNQHRTPNHVLKIMANYVQHRMPSLRKMYEEGSRERKEQTRAR